MFSVKKLLKPTLKHELIYLRIPQTTYDRWRPLSLSELTLYYISLGLTDLSSETSK